ncbi:MAG: TonB-dependent receptor plug domain-containing protein [Bacteroidota bacterium]
MKSYFHLLLLLIFGWLSIPVVNAQMDSLSIPEIEVMATKIRNQNIGGQTQTWEASEIALLASNNVAELLSQESGVYVKSYGLGSLATSSIRGGSASHTLVLWNGLPIQSPMLGQLDLSLLPITTSDEITLQKGGNSAMWGSGAIGGVIGLSTNADFSNKFKADISSTIGSFGQYTQQGNFNFGNDKLQFVTKVLHHQAENDFFYFLASNFPLRQQTNARVAQLNLLQDIYWKINTKNQIVFHLWRQTSDRQIPPTNVQNASLARQDDFSTRMILDWKRIGSRWVTQGKVGFFDEDLNYYDDATRLESLSSFKTLIGELTTERTFRNYHKFSIGTTHLFTQADSGGIPNSPTEHRTALFGAYQFRKLNWTIQSSIRQEMVEGAFIPIVPTLGVDYFWNKHLTSKLKVSKNYRIPTFNDRFWALGGNPDLLAESGWSAEGSIVSNFSMGKIKSKYTVTGFNRLINNRIIWLPTEGKPYWSAQNVSKVWSRGLEQRLSLFYDWKDWELKLTGGYDFIKSTNEEQIEFPKTEKGQQLLYVPVHQGFGKLTVGWNNLNVSYQHSFTGSVTAINEKLANYRVGNANVNYTFIKKKYQASIFLIINNLWNTDYFVIERRPMPRRSFQVGVNFQFHR